MMVNLGNIMDLIGGSREDSRNQALEKKTGVQSGTVLKLASLAIPLILRGISKNMDSKDGKESFNQALEQHKGKVTSAGSIEDLIARSDENDGDKILNHIFPNKKAVVSQVAEQTGVDQAQVRKVMASLAPLVLQTLADRKEQQNLDADGMARQTETLRQEAEQTAASQFQLTELFKQFGSSDQKDSGLGGALGNILNNLF